MRKFRIESSHSVYTDDYEQGQGSQLNSYEMDEIINAETPREAIEKYMETVVGFDFDINQAIFEDGVLFYSTLVDGANIQASDRQIESWKRGKCILCADQFSIVIYELNKVSL